MGKNVLHGSNLPLMCGPAPHTSLECSGAIECAAPFQAHPLFSCQGFMYVCMRVYGNAPVGRGGMLVVGSDCGVISGVPARSGEDTSVVTKEGRKGEEKVSLTGVLPCLTHQKAVKQR